MGIRSTNITLYADQWAESNTGYEQVVTINGVTPNTSATYTVYYNGSNWYVNGTETTFENIDGTSIPNTSGGNWRINSTYNTIKFNGVIRKLDNDTHIKYSQKLVEGKQIQAIVRNSVLLDIVIDA
jgi:hypothetical protein